MSFIDDFASIKADLARIESDKKPKAIEVTEGKATDWADVYGYTDVQKAYGWPYSAEGVQLGPHPLSLAGEIDQALGNGWPYDAAAQLKDGSAPEFVDFWRELKQANSGNLAAYLGTSVPAICADALREVTESKLEVLDGAGKENRR